MPSILSRDFIINKGVSSGEEVYEAIIDQLDENDEMLISLLKPEVKSDFIKKWTPTGIITVDDRSE